MPRSVSTKRPYQAYLIEEKISQEIQKNAPGLADGDYTSQAIEELVGFRFNNWPIHLIDGKPFVQDRAMISRRGGDWYISVPLSWNPTFDKYEIDTDSVRQIDQIPELIDPELIEA